MKHVKSSEVPPGLYRVYWRSGGSSLAAVGVDNAGLRWIGACNWVSACAVDGDGNSVWDDVIGCVLVLTPDDDAIVERSWSEVTENTHGAYTIVQDVDAKLRARVQSVIAWLSDTKTYCDLCDGTISPDAVLSKLRAALKA